MGGFGIVWGALLLLLRARFTALAASAHFYCLAWIPHCLSRSLDSSLPEFGEGHPLVALPLMRCRAGLLHAS